MSTAPSPQLPRLLPHLARSGGPAPSRWARPIDLDPLVAGLIHIWGSLRRLGVRVAMLIAWFAADPRRIRAAALGLTVCAAVGAVLGAGVGYGLHRLADALNAFTGHLAAQTSG